MSAPAKERVWSRGGIDVVFRDELDGAGMLLADGAVDCVRRTLPGPVDAALEWCAGPAFLGFALLAEGLCRRLYTTDINPASVDCVRETARRNGLEDRVVAFEGDNLSGVPADLRVDLVIANPPNFFHINPDHPLHAVWGGDLRPNDPGWDLHRRFYAGISRHLAGGARVLVSEVEADEARPRIPRRVAIPFDLRDRAPAEAFPPMMAAGGLEHLGTEEYVTLDDGVRLQMMVSRPASPRSHIPRR